MASTNDGSTSPRQPLKQVAAFQYVTVQNAPAYRAIVQVLYEAKQRYAVEMRPSEIRAALQTTEVAAEFEDESALDRHLDSLVSWGNLAQAHDSTGVSRLDDFYRRRFLYHMTAVGEVAHRAVLEVEATVGRAGSLQASMLVKIRDALQALPGAAAQHDSPAVWRLLHDVEKAFETLTEEANRFMGELSRHTSGSRLDEERFVAYKQAVLAYISRFVEQLRSLAAEIVAAIAAVDAVGLPSLIAMAAASGELPPTIDGTDPKETWSREQITKWMGVRGWFIGEITGSPTVERLADVAIEAVVSLARTLSRLNDRRTRPVDRAADFRTLARWFAACSNERAAHQLWQSAFGLYGARHFHIEEADPELTRATTSWWQARPVEVPIRLRTHGTTSNAGRPSPAADHTLSKEWIAQRRRRELAQLAVASQRFAEKGRLRFSQLVSVDSAEFDLLLDLLDQALTSPPREDGSRSVRTADGRFLVTLWPPQTTASRVVLETPRGRLLSLDYFLEVTGATSPKVALAVSSEGT